MDENHTEKKRWGRWILDGDFIVYDPEPGTPDPCYEISASALEGRTEENYWLNLLRDKVWIRSNDLDDFEKASEYVKARSLKETGSGPAAPMEWEVYRNFLQADWKRYLNSADQSDEKLFQSYLELHPSLLPDPIGHHELCHEVVFSQPELPGFRPKRPDFLLFAAHSECIYPVLIEIEAPGKVWCNADGTPTSKFTQALDQIRQWRAWMEEPSNQLIFRKTYRIDSKLLMGRQIQPMYVLIYGRRADALKMESFAKKRRFLSNQDEHIMSYDRLGPGWHIDALTVKLDRSTPDATWRVISIPPTFSITKKNAVGFSRFSGRRDAIAGSPLLTEARKAFLAQRVQFADEYASKQKI